jgi:hypothetical protein
LGAGDCGRAGDRQSRVAEGRRGGGDGVPGRHEVIDDHHPDRPGRPDLLGPGDELSRRRNPALSRGELGGVRPVGSQRQDWGDADRDAMQAEDPGRMPGQPLDVLPATATGHRVRRRDRDEPHRPALQLLDRRRQGDGQRPREIATTPFLVGQQTCSRDPGVLRGHRDGRQTRRRRIRAVSPRPDDRLPAPHADGSAAGGAAGAPAREGQIGQGGKHATTVPPSAGSR